MDHSVRIGSSPISGTTTTLKGKQNMSKKEENPKPPKGAIKPAPPPPPPKRIVREDISFKAFIGIPDEAFDVAIRKVRIWVVSQKKMIYDIKLNGTYIPADGIVMLSSDISDINGKEIYELDKLNFARAYDKTGPCDNVVKIVNGCFSVDGFPLCSNNVAALEVVGNVFE